MFVHMCIFCKLCCGWKCWLILRRSTHYVDRTRLPGK